MVFPYISDIFNLVKCFWDITHIEDIIVPQMFCCWINSIACVNHNLLSFSSWHLNHTWFSIAISSANVYTQLLYWNTCQFHKRMKSMIQDDSA